MAVTARRAPRLDDLAGGDSGADEEPRSLIGAEPERFPNQPEKRPFGSERRPQVWVRVLLPAYRCGAFLERHFIPFRSRQPGHEMRGTACSHTEAAAESPGRLGVTRSLIVLSACRFSPRTVPPIRRVLGGDPPGRLRPSHSERDLVDNIGSIGQWVRPGECECR